MCNASSPAVCDFSCGFHPSLSCGMRSRNLRVILASCSNSPSMACAMDIIAPLKKLVCVSDSEICQRSQATDLHHDLEAPGRRDANAYAGEERDISRHAERAFGHQHQEGGGEEPLNPSPRATKADRSFAVAGV